MSAAVRMAFAVILLACNLPMVVFAQSTIGDPYPNPGMPYPMMSGAPGFTGMPGIDGTCDTCAHSHRPLFGGRRLCTRCQRRGCCGNCGGVAISAPIQSVAPCPCQPPMMQPMVVPSVSYQDVPQTMVRRESYTVAVPVTTYRTVAEVTMQQQVKYRDVPYTVMQKVPQVTYNTTYAPMQAVSTGCNTCNHQPMMMSNPNPIMMQMMAPNMMPQAMVPQEYNTQPQQALVPQMTPQVISNQPIPEIGNLNVPTPTADPSEAVPQTGSLEPGWQVIRKRGEVARSEEHHHIQQQAQKGYDNDHVHVPATASGKFTGVPPTGSVMHAHRNTDSVYR